jgi:hypothetical protein
MFIRLALARTAGLVVLLCAGCGESFGNRQEISGTVKLKGELLDEGVIEFHPLAGGSGDVTKSGALITKGAYKIAPVDGLVPGKYRVTITSGDGRTPAGAPDDAPPGPTGANIVSKDRIPPEYNVKSKQEVEVKSGQPNVFNYDIP